jgi:hypothetical protein
MKCPWGQCRGLEEKNIHEKYCQLKSIEHRIRNIEDREFSVWGNELET